MRLTLALLALASAKIITAVNIPTAIVTTPSVLSSVQSSSSMPPNPSAQEMPINTESASSFPPPNDATQDANQDEESWDLNVEAFDEWFHEYDEANDGLDNGQALGDMDRDADSGTDTDHD